jgi:hypothetical protein
MEVFKERDKTQERGRVKAGKWTSRFLIRPLPLECFVRACECVNFPVPEHPPVLI